MSHTLLGIVQYTYWDCSKWIQLSSSDFISHPSCTFAIFLPVWHSLLSCPEYFWSCMPTSLNRKYFYDCDEMLLSMMLPVYWGIKSSMPVLLMTNPIQHLTWLTAQQHNAGVSLYAMVQCKPLSYKDQQQSKVEIRQWTYKRSTP